MTKPLVMKLTALNQFRWVKANWVHNDKSKTLIVEGGVLGRPNLEGDYLLQQKWVSEEGVVVWQNIEIEFNPT